MGHWSKLLKRDIFMSLKIDFIMANSGNPDNIPP